MKEFKIQWSETMYLLIAGKWLRGNKFLPGQFLKLDIYDRIVMVDVRTMREDVFANLKFLSENLYRNIEMATIHELKD